jgi:hypothetical protein
MEARPIYNASVLTVPDTLAPYVSQHLMKYFAQCMKK